MTLLKSAAIALAMYSRIPMPRVDWNEKNMRYAICFFPVVGAVIGALEYGWFALADFWKTGAFARTCLAAAIPLLVTGGIHVDGFMDTCDALHSYGTREQKLSILKDAHIGAFAVIMLGTFALLYTGFLSQVQGKEALLLFAGGFVLARGLSGLGVLLFRSAKQEGLLYTFARTDRKRNASLALGLELAAAAAFLLYAGGGAGGLVCAAQLAVFWYYRHRAYRELDGVTGDTAGWFLCLAELSTAAVLAVCIWTGLLPGAG